MDNIKAHHVLLHRVEHQPSDDHVAFASGGMDADLNVQVPHEVCYIPLATYMGLGSPDEITVTVKPGNALER